MTFDPAIDAVLDGFMPIGDHPAVDSFAEAVLEHVANRPSPEAQQDHPVDVLEAKVDGLTVMLGEVLALLRNNGGELS